MMFSSDNRRIVTSRPGQGTLETIYVDQYGCEWHSISRAEADMLRSGTAPPDIRRITRDGKIVPCAP